MPTTSAAHGHGTASAAASGIDLDDRLRLRRQCTRAPADQAARRGEPSASVQP
jgi:hypothetical protein